MPRKPKLTPDERAAWKAQRATAKKATAEAARLAQDCPHCGAVKGERCHDYKGEAKEFCLERGRPHITRAKLQRRADYLNTKARAQYGPLFRDMADQELTPVTVESLQAEQLAGIRRGVANCGLAEHAAVRGFNWITMRHLRREAAKLIGEPAEAKLWACCERVYRTSVDHIFARYRQALCTTDKIDLAHEIRFDPARVKTTLVQPADPTKPPIEIKHDGRYLVVTETWPPEGYVPVLTDAEFFARFKLHHLHVEAPADLPEPDDGGLFERVILHLRRAG